MIMTTAEILPEKTYALNTKDRCDRCDRCGAQALVCSIGTNGELLWCGHHFNKYEAGIRAFSYEIYDERDKLLNPARI